MADMPQIEVALAGAADVEAVRSFYASVGYGGGLTAEDRVLITRQGDTIVAAAKLSPEGKTLVLRGMYVSEPLRGLGIGSKLLERISAEIGSSGCWCIPYTRLERLYSWIGFGAVEPEAAPEFLAARRERYVSAGHEVMIMGRPEGWVSVSV